MKSNLKLLKLGEVCEIFAGGDKPENFSPFKDENHQVPVFANGETNLGLQGFTDKAKINRPAVTVSARGTIGYAVLREKPFVPIVRLLTLIPDDKKLNAKYLYYYLTLYRQAGLGSSQPQLTVPDIAERKISMQSLSEQQAIGKVLSALDGKIEINNKINTELEQMAKTLYDYWFVQFDFPDTNSKPYRSSGGVMVYNEELKREIPKGWESGTLSNISKLIRGVSYDKNDIRKEFDDGIVPVLRATNISGNVIDLEDMVYVPAKNVSAEQLLNKFDILMTMSSGSKDHIGKNAFYYFDKKTAFGAFCAKLVAKNGFHFYLYSYTQSDFMFTTIHNECLGTNINNLNSTLVNGFRIVIPPNELVIRFNKQVSPIYERIGDNLRENQKLVELRDWLLPMLMNGQVTVK